MYGAAWSLIVCCLHVVAFVFFGRGQDDSTYQPSPCVFLLHSTPSCKSRGIIECLIPITRVLSSNIACCLQTAHRGFIIRLGTQIMTTVPHHTVKMKNHIVSYRTVPRNSETEYRIPNKYRDNKRPDCDCQIQVPLPTRPLDNFYNMATLFLFWSR